MTSKFIRVIPLMSQGAHLISDNMLLPNVLLMSMIIIIKMIENIKTDDRMIILLYICA